MFPRLRRAAKAGSGSLLVSVLVSAKASPRTAACALAEGSERLPVCVRVCVVWNPFEPLS